MACWTSCWTRDFDQNKTIYLSYAEPVGVFSARTAVARATLVGRTLEKVSVILRQLPEGRGGRHFGSRIVPDGKGGIYVTLGDRADADEAQNPATSLGKIVRLDMTQSAPSSPDFVEKPDAARPDRDLVHRPSQSAGCSTGRARPPLDGKPRRRRR